MSRSLSLLRRAVEKWQAPAVSVVAEKTRDPFWVLVSCVLSLRTKDETTAEATARLQALAKTPAEMLHLSVPAITRAIYPVGFYKTKARHLRQICADLIGRFGGRVPDTIEELLTLKGVGRKTANLVVTVGY
ncbi:MAG: endonuclease III, partial [Nitrospirae bacterium]|nr:endonuclease III [Nitrospirota bacterium]